jgi:hypothetical protein
LKGYAHCPLDHPASGRRRCSCNGAISAAGERALLGLTLSRLDDERGWEGTTKVILLVLIVALIIAASLAGAHRWKKDRDDQQQQSDRRPND